MDYEKKYNEALERARNLMAMYPQDAPGYKEVFPELRESEDERITRAINNMLPFIPDESYANNGVTKEGVLNWLEKQKEPKRAPDDLQKSFEAGQTSIVDNQEQYGLCKKAEWSEEDADMLNCCISSIEEAKENRYAYKETDGDTSYDREIDWLKSLRPDSYKNCNSRRKPGKD